MIRRWLAHRRAVADARVLRALTDLGNLSSGPLMEATGLGPIRAARTVQRLMSDGRITQVGRWIPTDFGGHRSIYRYSVAGRSPR